MFSKITSSPTLVRVLPFAIFVGFTSLQGRLGENSQYWIYFIKTIVGAGLLFLIWRHVAELEWRFSWEAVAVGLGVFVMWVGLDSWYPVMDVLYPKHICPLFHKIGLAKSCVATPHPPWDPVQTFGNSSTMSWFFIAARIAGSTLVVPPMEELFYRSFVYRFLASKDLLSTPLGRFLPMPFFVTSVLFGFAHNEWLAGILCGFAYQGLVIWKNRLGDAVTAHAITNFLLGLWIVWRGAWHFW